MVDGATHGLVPQCNTFGAPKIWCVRTQLALTCLINNYFYEVHHITKKKQTHTCSHNNTISQRDNTVSSKVSSPLYGEHQNVCVDRLDDDARPKHKDEPEAVFG